MDQIDEFEIENMDYEDAIAHLLKVTGWPISRVIDYVTIAKGIQDSDVVEVGENKD